MPSIRSNRVVVDGEVRPARLTFGDGLVEEVTAPGVADRDYGDLVIMPGLVDTHVHVNDPGRAGWEGFTTATRAAAAGGSTTIVDMPLNSIPPTISVEALEVKRSAAEGRLYVDVGFWGGLVPGSQPQLRSLVAEGVSGFKAFMVDSGVPEFPPVSEVEMRRGFVEIAELGVPVLIHAEDTAGLRDPDGVPNRYGTYLASRPAEAEAIAISTVSRLAEATGASAHILHVASSDAIEAITTGAARMTGETCPHYLCFSSEEIGDGRTLLKCAPPIRESTHREALWSALRTGALSMVVSDHSPSPPELKRLGDGDFVAAWGGISSLQLRLPATWTGASQRGFDLVDLVSWLAINPARLAGLYPDKGSIQPGSHADFVIWDPDEEVIVKGSELEHRHPITPYEGMTLRGSVAATILRGTDIFDDGHVVGPHGRMLRR